MGKGGGEMKHKMDDRVWVSGEVTGLIKEKEGLVYKITIGSRDIYIPVDKEDTELKREQDV